MRLLERARGEGSITSARIEALSGWESHTVRKDISFLGPAVLDTDMPLEQSQAAGGNGRIGSSGGYDPDALISLIKRALGLDKRRKFCVVGLGRLGSAYLNVPEIDGTEFELAAGFDSNVNRTEILRTYGSRTYGSQSPVPLYPAYKMGEVIGRFNIEIALLCVPPEAAQAVAERLAQAGIRGILNFAPLAIAVPQNVVVRNVYLTDELRALAIRMP